MVYRKWYYDQPHEDYQTLTKDHRQLTEDKDVRILQKDGERVENLDRLWSGWWNARAGRSATAARPCSLQPAPLSYRDEHTQQYSEWAHQKNLEKKIFGRKILKMCSLQLWMSTHSSNEHIRNKRKSKEDNINENALVCSHILLQTGANPSGISYVYQTPPSSIATGFEAYNSGLNNVWQLKAHPLS